MKRKIRKNIVVNADDFGKSSSINKAIIGSFQSEVISSTTIMSTMPGFEEACEIAHERRITDRIGVHLNLTEGKPLTEKIRRLTKFCDLNGEFQFKTNQGNFLNSEEQLAVEEELLAQIEKCRKMKIYPSHIDSHHHFHHRWSLGKVVIKLAKKYQIPAVRLCFNWGNRLSLQRKVYGVFMNKKLQFYGLAKTKFFCEIQDATSELLRTIKPIEIMVHPRICKSGTITNYDAGESLIPLVNSLLPSERFCSYSFLNTNACN